MIDIPARRYLLFTTKRYSIPILRPLEKFILEQRRGDVMWYIPRPHRDTFMGDNLLFTTAEVERFSPDAVIVPGNVVPHFWPGLKVQIFHGLAEEKRGHYRLTGFFDLYCTPGPAMTKRFLAKSEKAQSFLVVQTGWPKLDPLRVGVSSHEAKATFGLDPNRPLILYAPTFSPRYSSAYTLRPELVCHMNKPWQWAIKFHELMDKNVAEGFWPLKKHGVMMVESEDILPWLEAADVLLTDTSSVAAEFLLLDRPIVTFRARSRHDKGIDMKDPTELGQAIERALANPEEHTETRRGHLAELHPYTDGLSSKRVLEAIENVLANSLQEKLLKKPANFLDKWKIRRMVRRWER